MSNETQSYSKAMRRPVGSEWWPVIWAATYMAAGIAFALMGHSIEAAIYNVGAGLIWTRKY